MEHQIQGSDGAQVVSLNGQQLVVQMNPQHMIQGPNGQQIVVHSIPQSAQAIQVATQNGQQLQVLPISSLQGAGNNIQPMQLVQTPDGQTYLYQANAATQQPTIDQHQLLHQPTVINLNGNLVQVAGVGNAVQQQQIVNQPNIVMMVNNNNNNTTMTAAASPSPGTSADMCSGNNDEEPLLYVNARQYKRILKRRIARARLHELGKIPKERPKYLHESRHKHAMNRIRGEGGRFHPGSRKNNNNNADGSDELSDTKPFEEMKPDTVSITIIQDDETQQGRQQNHRIIIAPQQTLPST